MSKKTEKKSSKPAKTAKTAPQLRPVVAFDFSFVSPEGMAMPLAAWQGRPLLIVNTASQCGFTPQFKELQELWTRYRDRGLVVIGVASNDFGKQEPLPDDQLRGFCTREFAVDFPLTGKTKVFGFGKHPFYKWAGRWAGFIGSPKWNFHKYLVAPEGFMYDWFLPTTSPLEPQVTQAVERLLEGQISR